MGELSFITEVLDTVIADPGQEYVLFALKDILVDQGAHYDLVFHQVKGIKLDALVETEYLAIPVLKHRYPEDYAAASLEFYELAQRKQFLRIFGLRDSSKDCAISFFHLNKLIIGSEIKKIEEYGIASEAKFKEIIPNWGRISSKLSEFRNEIDNLYNI